MLERVRSHRWELGNSVSGVGVPCVSVFLFLCSFFSQFFFSRDGDALMMHSSSLYTHAVSLGYWATGAT